MKDSTIRSRSDFGPEFRPDLVPDLGSDLAPLAAERAVGFDRGLRAMTALLGWLARYLNNVIG
jgi:hypothetical protein